MGLGYVANKLGGFEMKKMYLIVLIIINAYSSIMPDGIYLWEYRRNGERSCCLSLSGNDICNPQTPCTRNVYSDVMGINDYITRLLGLEKAGSMSYATILTQAQYYIRHVLGSSITQLMYRFDEQHTVKFFHEMVDTPKPNEKAAKSTTSAATTPAAGTATVGAKKDDPVFQYLVKLGLAREWRK